MFATTLYVYRVPFRSCSHLATARQPLPTGQPTHPRVELSAVLTNAAAASARGGGCCRSCSHCRLCNHKSSDIRHALELNPDASTCAAVLSPHVHCCPRRTIPNCSILLSPTAGSDPLLSPSCSAATNSRTCTCSACSTCTYSCTSTCSCARACTCARARTCTCTCTYTRTCSAACSTI